MEKVNMDKPYIEVKQGFVKINGQDVNTIRDLNVHYGSNSCGCATVTMKLDAMVDIEGTAEIIQEKA